MATRPGGTSVEWFAGACPSSRRGAGSDEEKTDGRQALSGHAPRKADQAGPPTTSAGPAAGTATATP